MQVHGRPVLPWWLATELVLLLGGFGFHLFLHHRHPARRWARMRLIAEIMRSGRAVQKTVPGYLSYLFTLPIPDDLRPLLRTLNVLHLRDTRMVVDPLEVRRQRYANDRLRDEAKKAQIPYFGRELKDARRGRFVATWTFTLASVVAILATSTELALLWLDPEHATGGMLSFTLATVAIVLPVLAVGALPLSVSLDFEARVSTFTDMLRFLGEGVTRIEAATSDREFTQLVMETEAKLLGENVAWYWRRTFTN